MLLSLLGARASECQFPTEGQVYYIRNVNILPQNLYLYNSANQLKADQQEIVEGNHSFLWRCVANGEYLQFRNMQNGKYLGYRGFSDEAYNFKVEAGEGTLVTLYDVSATKYLTIKKDGSVNVATDPYNTTTWSSYFEFEPWEELSEETEWATGIDWYTFRIGASGYYITDGGGADRISLSRTTSDLEDTDLWTRQGNDNTGYMIYNKAAGPQMVLAAPTTMKGTTGAESYPILVPKNNIPEGYTAVWSFAPSTDLTFNDPAQKGYYMYEAGYPANKVNIRNSTLAFWTGGADSGSTIYFTWAKVEQEVNMDKGTFTAFNGNKTWAKTWTSHATTPQYTLDAGYNNMSVANSKEGTIQAFRGNYEPQAYTLSAGSDYIISAYSFDFVMSGQVPITVTDALGHTFTSSAEPQHIEVSGLDQTMASFTLSGSNNGIDITNMRVTICARQQEPEPQFEVFTTASTSAIPYRIPAIATAYDGTVVAVADYRYSRQDIGSGRIDLHIRRSHDNGATWDNILKPSVMQGDGIVKQGHQQGGYGDPCIVGDSESPRMMITSCSGSPGFFGGNRTYHQGWARWYSEDNGLTWGEPAYIEEEYIYKKFDNSAYGPITGWFVGSGKITQSRKTKVADYYRLYCAGSSYNGSQTANWVLYSDDFGESWEFLGGCDVSPIPGGDEPKVEELPDGSILLSSRCTGGRNFNIFTFTNTRQAQGEWANVCFSGSSNKGVTALSNACNGEVILVPVTRKADNKDMFLLLQSVPFGSGRTNVGIYYKELDKLDKFRTTDSIAANWTGRHQSSYIGSAYSTFTWQQDNTLGFLYEEETHCGTGGGGYTIIYKNYSIEQITDSAYTYKADVDGDALTAAGMKEIVDAFSAGSFVGQYTPEGVASLQESYNTYASNPNREGYEQLNQQIKQAPKVEIEQGRYYRLRNYGRGNRDYYLTATGGTSSVLGVQKNVNEGSDNQLFCFELKDNGSWKIRSKGCTTYPYISKTPATETRVTMVKEANAGSYVIASNTDGLSTLRCTAPTNANYPYLHLAGDNTRVVCWSANSPSANGPSYWYIEPTDITITGISTVEEQLQEGQMYDLLGRLIHRPATGIYIERVNGKARKRLAQ